MRKLLLPVLLCMASALHAQSPCSDSLHRQFDFWIGEWDVYGITGQKAGDSKISLILDSCIVLEEWTSAAVNRGVRYAGKSFNTYNRATRQWQQTWVDNVGGSTAYLNGYFKDQMLVFQTNPFAFRNDTIAIRRLTFHHLGPDKVRQHSEITKDNMKTWNTEYDLEYRRRKKDS